MIADHRIFDRFRQVLQIHAFIPLVEVLAVPVEKPVVYFTGRLDLDMVETESGFIQLVPDEESIERSVHFQIQVEYIIALGNLRYIFEQGNIGGVPFGNK